MTDKELEKIYNEAYRAVYWTAFALLKNEADAEDVVQDTFITLIESYDSLKDKDKVLPWLKRIAANKCLDRIKLAKTDNMDDEFFDSQEAVPEDFLPDSIIESAEARGIVMSIIDEALSREVRTTLILFYFDEMTTKEIADALGIPQGTVLWRLNFAKKKIKKEVERYEKENNTKLFSMALPFLSKLFIKEAEQMPFKAMPASLINLSASAKIPANGAGTKIAINAAKKGTGVMINKIVIGGIAAAGLVTVAATAGAIVFIAKAAGAKPNADASIAVQDTELNPTEDVIDHTIESTARETYGREFFENGGFDGEEKYYLIQDLSAEEIVGVYEHYRVISHGYEIKDLVNFDRELEYPADCQPDGGGEGLFMCYDGILPHEKLDHITSFSVSGYSLTNHIEFTMQFNIHDPDKVQEIVDAFVEYYGDGALEIKEYNLNGMYDSGYWITYDDDQDYIVCYSECEFEGNYYYAFWFSECT